MLFLPTFESSIIEYLWIDASDLASELAKPEVRIRVERKFAGVRLFTLYKNAYNRYMEFDFDKISIFPAEKLQALTNYYNNHKFQTTVEEFFFVKHQISLKNPQNPCAILSVSKGEKYYTLELVSIMQHVPNYTLSGIKQFESLKSRHFQYSKDYRTYLSKLERSQPKILGLGS